MTRLAEGSIIQVGITQIQDHGKKLTKKETKLANELAKLISESEKESVSAVGGPGKITKCYNWLPVYVTEHGIRNYKIVGSPAIFEACKIAGLRIMNCIQVDHSPQATKQVELMNRFAGL